MPKMVQRFFIVAKQCENPEDESSGTPEETPENDPSRDVCVTVIDKRKSVNIQCETVWTKINRKMGTVFDRRKMKRRETEEPEIGERYVSSYLDTAFGERSKKQRTELEQIQEEEEESKGATPESVRTPDLRSSVGVRGITEEDLSSKVIVVNLRSKESA